MRRSPLLPVPGDAADPLLLELGALATACGDPAGASRFPCARGPRPVSQPAHSSATNASPGTYQVQSTNECAPNVTTMQSMLSSPIRSGV